MATKKAAIPPEHRTGHGAVRNLDSGNDILDIMIEQRPPFPIVEISLTKFTHCRGTGFINGQRILAVWESRNFGYLWTLDTIYRC